MTLSMWAVGCFYLSKIYLVKGKSATLPAAVQPYFATDKGVTWESANPKIDLVNAGTGKVKGVKQILQ